MGEIDFLKFIFTAGIASLIGGGAGVAFVVFLSKKLIDQILKKDIEKYKTELSCELKLKQEVNKYNFDEETKVIKELWIHIESIVSLCANYQGECDNDNLNKLNGQLKICLSKNKPFIYKSLDDFINNLIEISNVENYSPENYNEVTEIRDCIIQVLRQRLNLF